MPFSDDERKLIETLRKLSKIRRLPHDKKLETQYTNTIKELDQKLHLTDERWNEITQEVYA